MRPNQLALDTAVTAAQAAAEAGDFQTAAAAFQAAIALDHNDAALHEQHAQCLMELGQYDDAAKAAARATTLHPAVSFHWQANRNPRWLGPAAPYVVGLICCQGCGALPLNPFAAACSGLRLG